MVKRELILACAVVLCIAGGASASLTFDVYALNHSITTPLDTGVLVNPGQRLIISVDPLDMWRAGSDVGGVREGNADGLGNPYGFDFGFFPYGSSSFRYGTLVGQIDSGNFFEVGTSYDAIVTQAGNLKLLYWDSYYDDNSGYVTATVTVVPVPGALLLVGAGTVALGWLRRRRTL